MEILNRWKRRINFRKELVIVAAMVVLASILIGVLILRARHRNICLNEIDYLPTSQSYIYGRYERKYFKDQNEAVNYCLRNRSF